MMPSLRNVLKSLPARTGMESRRLTGVFNQAQHFWQALNA
jgi:hypothetical protein